MNPIYALFDKQAQEKPDAQAVRCGGRSMTYRQLAHRADELCGILPDCPGKLVSLELDRGADYIAAMLAVLRKGMAYLPVAGDCPRQRREFMLRDSNVFVRLIQGEADPEPVRFAGYDEHGPEYPGEAYVVYTSGSTGEPKGMPISVSSLEGYIEGFPRLVPLGECRTIACLTTVSFDIFFIETILPLCIGMTVAMAGEEEQASPAGMAGLIAGNRVDCLQMIPSRLQILLYRDPELTCLRELKLLMLGGEPLPPALLKILQTHTKARIFNLYGPTETTLWATAAELTRSSGVTLGEPFSGYRVFVADEALRPAAPGTTGQICIQGPGLTRGYINRPEQMRAHFTTGEDGRPLYLTGDLARLALDGSLAFVGRMDNQVKIRGNRVELEEIEACAMRAPGIVQAVASVYEIHGENHLCLFYQGDGTAGQAELSAALKEKLPGYMIPSAWAAVGEFPQLRNGKVDRSRLKYRPEEILAVSPDPEKDPLLETVREVLAQCGCRTDDLSERSLLTGLGLDSVSFVRMVVELEEALGIEFDDEMMSFDALPTLGALMEYLSAETGRVRRGEAT